MKKTKVKNERKKFSEAIFQRVIETVTAGSLIGPAIQKEGIGRTTFYRNIENDRDKRDALKRAQIAGPVSKLAAEGYRRAVEGNERAVYHQGVECGRYREYSDTLLIFLLKKWNPEVYDDKPASNTNVVLNNQRHERSRAMEKQIEARIKKDQEIGDRLLAQFEANLNRQKNSGKPPEQTA